MFSGNIINVDIGNMIRQADLLEQAAETLDKINKNRIDSIANSVNSAWKGESARLYENKMRKMHSRVDKQVRDLKRMSNSLRKTAETYKMLEAASYGLFRH